jgi:hypothetical protein
MRAVPAAESRNNYDLWRREYRNCSQTNLNVNIFPSRLLPKQPWKKHFSRQSAKKHKFYAEYVFFLVEFRLSIHEAGNDLCFAFADEK